MGVRGPKPAGAKPQADLWASRLGKELRWKISALETITDLISRMCELQTNTEHVCVGSHSLQANLNEEVASLIEVKIQERMEKVETWLAIEAELPWKKDEVEDET